MKVSTGSVHALIEPSNQPAYQLSMSAFYNGGEHGVIRIQATDDPGTDHIPATVVLCIDESGSMMGRAVSHDDSDGASGLTQLDVVKHAARTIVKSLGPQDQVAIVAFSARARVVLPLTFMTEENQAYASKKIENLRPLTSTNLYDGLHTSLELIRTAGQTDLSINTNVMLLTDGLPNINPPRGELETLRRYLDSYPEQRNVRISTFGFGYSLQSRLLSDIATEGGSIYAFIPDASFVGTVFINSMANLLSAAAPQGATLKIEAQEGVEIRGCPSGHKFTPTSWGVSIDIPSILYGQTIDVVVELGGGSPSTKPVLGVDPFAAILETDTLENPLECHAEMIDPLDPEEGIMRLAAIRSNVVSFIREIEDHDKQLSHRTEEDLKRAQDLLRKMKERVAILADSTNEVPGIGPIRKDIDGQISEAFSSQAYYKRWGSHYVLSLAGAHVLQQCINFKDPGIQEYATDKFKSIRDASEAIFLKLEPPKPSRVATAPIASMRAYYSASAPCFAAGDVTLENGSKMPISQLQAGDVVKTREGSAKVRCIVETPCSSGMEELVELPGGVVVTPWHPVRLQSENRWTFPCFLAETKVMPCERVYSFVLDGDTSLIIGNYDGIALGHGIQNDKLLQHDFLGTDKVIHVLSTMHGWQNGRVYLAESPSIRMASPGSSCSGKIMGFRAAGELST